MQGMSDVGWLSNSDLSRPGPRRRAAAWTAVCAAFVLALVGFTVGGGGWHLLLLACFFAFEGVRTARRLMKSRSE